MLGTLSRKNAMRKRLPLILAGCILLIGCALLSYTAIANWYNQKHQSELFANYNDAVSDIDNGAAEAELQKAEAYNRGLKEIVDPFGDSTESADYSRLLNFTAEGVMGYVEIPKISVLLPIYHGVGSGVLSKGIGHLPETSLPVGGANTHCVLAGHSGMSYARLFTDLPKLEIGDVFYIHVYNKSMEYTVDQIKTVKPTNVTDLTIMEGKDYVTLVTCVPRGVNSHRLLVRGCRTT